MNTLDKRITELIHAEVDGVLAVEDREELKAALEASAMARTYRAEMLRLADILNKMPGVEPPPELNRRILDSIELPTRRQMPAWLRSWFQPASYGLAFAAGMLLTVGMVKLIPVNDSEMSSLVGTMVKHDNLVANPSHGQLAIDLEAVKGSVLLENMNGTLALQFDLKSTETVDIDIQLAASGLKFSGFADDDEGIEVLEVLGGNVRVVNQGSQQFVLFLRPLDKNKTGKKDLDVTISQDHKRIFEGSITFGG